MGKILVTGGAGFIGSHTCVVLLEQGYELVILDNFYNSKPEALRRIRQITGKDFAFYEADVCDRAALDAVFAKEDIEAVIHFAGYKAVGESVKEPLMYYENNVGGAVCLCRAMEAAGCRNFVFSSSATVYDPGNPIPYVEGYPLGASNPYGWTKVMIERILTDTAAAHPEWSVALLRYFNPIGAHESGLLGENPNGIPNNLVPYIAQVAIGKLPHLNVFGNDYDTPDGTGVRDYIHVMDLAEGHVAALDYVLKHTGVEAVNLGTGKGSSVLEVAAAYEKACERSIPLHMAPRRAGDIAAFFAATEKAKALLGWEARRSMEEMCRDSWRFTEQNPNGL